MKRFALLALISLFVGIFPFFIGNNAMAGPLPCSIGEPGCGAITLTNPIGLNSVGEVIERIIQVIAFYLGPPIVIILVMIGAYQMLFAAGDPERFSTGKKTVLYAIIGYVVLLLSTGIGYIILDVLR